MRTRSGDGGWRAALGLVAALLLLAAAAAALPQASCALAGGLVLLLAWPIWAWGREQMLFGRHLILAGATVPSGWLRRLFWHGTFSLWLRVPVAIAMAAVLLAMATTLTAAQWGILAADALLVAAVGLWLRRKLAGEVEAPHLGTVTRRWPLLVGNTLVLVVAFTLHDYWGGFPDTRHLAWDELAQRAMASGREGASCPVLGGLLGVMQLAQQLPRHAALHLLPGLQDPFVEGLAWMSFLAVTGLGAYLLTRLLLGMQAVAEVGPAASRQGIAVYAWGVGAVLLLAWAALAWFPPRAVAWQGAPLRLAQATNPCTWDGPAALQTVAWRTDAQAQLDEATRLALAQAMADVERGLDASQALAAQGIEVWLDWYFSLVGSYTRLAAPVIPGLAQQMQERFARIVFAESGYEGRVQTLAGHADERLLSHVSEGVQAIRERLAQQARSQPCAREWLRPQWERSLGRDEMRVALAGAVALPVSRVLVQVAARAGEAWLARALSRQSVRAAAGAAGRTAAGRGSGVLLSAGTAASVCTPGGPLALACGALAAVVTWLGVDIALITLDEALFRDRLRTELTEELQAHRAALQEAMRLQLEQTARVYRLQAQEALGAVFVPARGG